VKRVFWVFSTLGMFLLLQIWDIPLLSGFFLGWCACEAWGWERDDLLAFYRKLLPTVKLRLEKLDALQKLFEEGWHLSPPTPTRVRNTRQEIADKMKLLRARTSGKH
jgi:hypothetical protein